MPSLDLLNPLPALNKWFSKRDRHPKQNAKSKKQHWFVGIFKEAAENGTQQHRQVNSDVTTGNDDEASMLTLKFDDTDVTDNELHFILIFFYS